MYQLFLITVLISSINNNHRLSPCSSSLSIYSKQDILENSKDNHSENLSNIMNSVRSLSEFSNKKSKNRKNFLNKFKKWINKIF